MGRLLISRAKCRAISARRRTTAHFTVVSTVLCSGYVVNKTVPCVLIWMWFWCQWYNNNCLDRSYYKEYVAVLSVLNLVSDFVKCNHPALCLRSQSIRRRHCLVFLFFVAPPSSSLSIHSFSFSNQQSRTTRQSDNSMDVFAEIPSFMRMRRRGEENIGFKFAQSRKTWYLKTQLLPCRLIFLGILEPEK
jgi:hypothetical protein